jgi:hypothetical protein
MAKLNLNKQILKWIHKKSQNRIKKRLIVSNWIDNQCYYATFNCIKLATLYTTKSIYK